MRPRWRKVLADLRDNKVRTILVVLSIAVGVFAVGGIAGAFDIIKSDMASDYRSVNPPSARLLTSLFDDDVVAAMRHVPGVKLAEGRSTLGARLSKPDGSRQQVSIAAIPRSGEMEINRIRRVDGGSGLDLEPHAVLLEFSAQSVLGVKPGDSLTLEMPDWSIRTVRVAGLVQDVTAGTVPIGFPVALYASPDTMEWLGGRSLYSQLQLVVSERADDLTYVKSVADRVADKLNGAGVTVYQISVARPDEHPAAATTDALLMVMSSLCVLTVALSAFLVTNTITALLGQQLRQIGVLKAIGARSWQVLSLYLALVAGFGLLALAVSLPLAGVFSWYTAKFVSTLTNFRLAGFRITPLALGLELLVAIFMPVAATLLPIWSGTRVTVREAIASYGLGHGEARPGLLARALARVRGLPRLWKLSLRNTFRRKARLALTLSALTLAGAIFIAVLDLQATFTQVIVETFGYALTDVNVYLGRAYRIDEIENLVSRVDGVSHIEAWTVMNAQALPADPAAPALDVQMNGTPEESTLIEPVLTAGRWVIPGDENAIVIGNHMVAKRPDLHVGDWMTVRIDDRESEWQVVGIYKMAGTPSSPPVYMNRAVLDRAARRTGISQTFKITTVDKSAASQESVARAVEQVFAGQKIVVGSIQTGESLRGQQAFMIGILVTFMLIMAVLIAIVGGLGLMGTMSMNVLERTREIGVLRAIGASNGTIMGMILLEGMLIGGLSWVLGSLLSLPIGIALAAGAGMAFVKVPMELVVAPVGMAAWLAIALGLSALASILPAWNAARLTIREILAYE